MVRAPHLLVAALIGGACTPVVPGTEGNLAFGFATDDRLFPVNADTAIAAGFAADVLVYETADGREPITVTDATIADASVATVRSTDANRVAIDAIAPGEAELAVTAGDTSDAFPFEVRALERVDLRYPGLLIAPADPPVAVLVGGEVRFGMDLFDDGRRMLIGYGDVPLTLDPPTAGTKVATRDVSHATVVFSTVGAASVTGQGDEALPLTVVARDALTALDLVGIGDQPLTAAGLFAVRGADGDDTPIFGLSGLVSVDTDDASVCTVVPQPTLGDTAYEVRAVAAGSCTVRATLDALEATATFDVQPAGDG